MRILGVYLENIRSYKKGLVVFPPTGITVIHGETGSGKTSLLMSIVFALFGPRRSSGGLFQAYKMPASSDLLRAGSTRGRVRLLIQVGDRIYLIERSLRKENSSYIHEHGVLEEYVIEHGSLKPVARRTQLSQSELNEAIINILGVREKRRDPRFTTPMVFPTAIYVPQFMVQEVLEQDESTRLEIIERALGLDKYKYFRINYSNVVKQLESRIKEKSSRIEAKRQLVRDANLEVIEEEIKRLIQELARIEEEIGKQNNELTRLQEALNSVNNEISKLTASREIIVNKLRDYEIKQSELKRLEERLANVTGSRVVNAETINEYISKLEDNLNKLMREQEEISNEIRTLSNELEELRKEREKIEEDKWRLLRDQTVMEDRRGYFLKELDKLGKQLSDVKELVNRGACPVCKQPITHEHGVKLVKELEDSYNELVSHIDSINASISEIKRKINSIESKLVEIRKSEESLRARLDALNSKRDEVSKKINECFEKKASLLSTLERWRSLLSEITSMDTQQLHYELKNIDENIAKKQEEYKKLHSMYEHVLARVRDLDREAGSIRVKIEERRRRKEEIERIINEINNETREIEQLKKLKEELEYSRIVVEEVEKEIMRRLADEFRYYFMSFIKELIPNQPIEIIVTDNFSLEGKIRIGKSSYPVSSLSGGQNIAISLAYRLALNQIVRSRSKTLRRGTLILDEPTTGFSRELVERLRELLRQISSGGDRAEGQVIVVTHDENLIGAGDCKIKLTLDATEHQTILDYDECELDPQYREFVENLLRGMFKGQAEEFTISSGSFEPTVKPARDTQSSTRQRSILDYMSTRG